MSTNQYLLQWNQHLENFAESFSSLRDQAEYVDCTLACEDGLVSAHRIVLAGCSSYFQQLFGRTGNLHPIIFLTNTHRSIVLLLMEFVYRGKAYVPQDKLTDLLELGRQLRIKGLVRVNTPSVDSLIASMPEMGPSTSARHTQDDSSLRAYEVDTTAPSKSAPSDDGNTSANGNDMWNVRVDNVKCEVASHSGDVEDLSMDAPVVNGEIDSFGGEGPSSPIPFREKPEKPSLVRRRGRPRHNRTMLPRSKTKRREALMGYQQQKDGYSLSPLDILMIGGYADKYGPEEALKFARKRHRRNFRLSTILRYVVQYSLSETKKKEKIEHRLVHMPVD